MDSFTAVKGAKNHTFVCPLVQKMKKCTKNANENVTAKLYKKQIPLHNAISFSYSLLFFANINHSILCFKGDFYG